MAFATVAAVVGLGTAAYGAVKQNQQVKKANRQAQAANLQSIQVQKESVKAAQASQRAEALRLKQMRVEGIRRRRDIMRQAQAARSVGIARAIAQGGLDSTSAQAGQNAASTNQRIDVLANLQNIMIGEGIFAENKKITEANTRGANFQTVANTYNAASQQSRNNAEGAQQWVGLGLNLLNNAGTIGRVGGNAYDTLFGNPWAATTTTSNGTIL